MESNPSVTLLLAANVLISYWGFRNRPFFDSYKFWVDGILTQKQFIRLISSGFLHAGWMHLAFNMIALDSFGNGLAWRTSELQMLLIYTVSLLGGSLLSLFLHRNHGDYTAIGASGAVSGLVFACIALDPRMEVGILFLPGMPGWLFGILYVLYSLYGIRSQSDNIGHDAHLGGALVGLFAVIALNPWAWEFNRWAILGMVLPALVFLVLIIKKPSILIIGGIKPRKPEKFYTVDDRYNAQKKARQQEMDRILEKIQKKGMNSLTDEERAFLRNN